MALEPVALALEPVQQPVLQPVLPELVPLPLPMPVLQLMAVPVLQPMTVAVVQPMTVQPPVLVLLPMPLPQLLIASARQTRGVSPHSAARARWTRLRQWQRRRSAGASPGP